MKFNKERFRNSKSASGANHNADSICINRSYSKLQNKKIKPHFPPKAEPLFCSFDKRIADYINRVGGYCFFMWNKDYHSYDLNFANAKEVWIFYLSRVQREISNNLGYALLRRNAKKVQETNGPHLAFPFLSKTKGGKRDAAR